MARWEEVIDHQVDLYNFWRSDVGQRYAKGYLDSVTKAAYLSDKDLAAMRNLHRDIPERAADFLYGADPIWVEPDMMTLVEHAAQTFEPEPLLANDVLTDRGFLYLPRPYVTTDLHGKTVSWRAVSWKIVHFSYRWTETNEIVRENLEGLWLYLYHERGDPDAYWEEWTGDLQARERDLPRLTLAHTYIWPFGHPYFDGLEKDVERFPFLENNLRQDAQFMGALFRLLTQTISVRTQIRPSRAYRKRAKTLPEKHITVVTLRRTREGSYRDHDDSEPHEWSHRWLVSGHWRNQWFPSLSAHRQIWISPYIKGPEEAPLLIRAHRVFKFAR